MEPAWGEAIERAATARLTVLIGDSDTGKTSLATAVANALLAGGDRVGVVDADLGQSEIGPPTMIGLGRLARPVQRLTEAEVVGLFFVGAISPPGHLLPTVIGTKRMVEKAFALGLDRVVVDTSGLVQGEIGRILKQGKIDLLDPDLVVCIERSRECEHILRPYGSGTRPKIVRLPPDPAARRRSPEERRLHRERALQRYFAPARQCVLDLSRVTLREPALFMGEALSAREIEELAALAGEMTLWAERRGSELTLVTSDPLPAPRLREIEGRSGSLLLSSYSLDDFQERLAGLDDRSRETLGLGIVRSFDPAKQVVVIETPVPEGAVAALRIGRHRFQL